MRLGFLIAAILMTSQTAAALTCPRVERGHHLALCLRTCDGTSLTIESTPSYEDIQTEVQQALFSGTIKRILTDEIARTATVDGPCGASNFSGDQCLIRTARRVFSRLSNPVDAYERLLRESKSRLNTRMLQEHVAQLHRELRALRTQMRSSGIDGFERQGAFLEQNLKNAPAYLCQLESFVANDQKAMSDLLVTTEANLRELERASEFFNDYRP